MRNLASAGRHGGKLVGLHAVGQEPKIRMREIYSSNGLGFIEAAVWAPEALSDAFGWVQWRRIACVLTGAISNSGASTQDFCIEADKNPCLANVCVHKRPSVRLTCVLCTFCQHGVCECSMSLFSTQMRVTLTGGSGQSQRNEILAPFLSTCSVILCGASDSYRNEVRLSCTGLCRRSTSIFLK